MIEPKLIHIREPKLTFGFDQKMEDPRDGLTLFGSYSKNKHRISRDDYDSVTKEWHFISKIYGYNSPENVDIVEK